MIHTTAYLNKYKMMFINFLNIADEQDSGLPESTASVHSTSGMKSNLITCKYFTNSLPFLKVNFIISLYIDN